MDAVIFSNKRAHLAGQRLVRALLKGSELTPARFDLMLALRHAGIGLKQSALWRQLGVVRSVVSEMLSALVRVGFVRRDRAAHDRRTWLVRLTKLGRDVFDRAHAECVDSGLATCHVDAAICDRDVEADAMHERYVRVGKSLAFAAALGIPRVPRDELYWWDYESFYMAFAIVGDEREPGDVPFVT